MRLPLPLVAALILASSTLASAQEAKQKDRKMSSQELGEWIDQRFAKEYVRAGVEPLSSVDDATYLRRLYLDLQGRIPSVSQLRDFMADEGSFKRQDYVDRLVNENRRPDRYAQRSSEQLARVWRRMMIPAASPGAGMAGQLEPWLARQFATNTPYDQFARKLLLVSTPPRQALGGIPASPTPEDPDAAAAVFQQAVGAMPENLASAYVRVFLGVRLNCAQCHDHPFTDWKRSDFWGVAAFFAGDGAKQASAIPAPSIRPEGDDPTVFTAKLLWSKEPLKEIPADKSPRDLLAEWMVSPENPNFSATAVNRIWQYLCGRGLAGSVDELDRVTPQERVVLNELAKLFVESGFDVRWLVTGICKSRVYQQSLPLDPAANNEGFIHRPLKTLIPEQVFDSLELALGLPTAKTDNGPRHNGEREQFVSRMNEAAPDTPVDYKGGIPQALMLMNGKLTADATSLELSRTLRAVVDAPFFKTTEQKLEAIYLAAVSRKPNAREVEFLLKHINEQPGEKERKQAFAEIMWGLLNSPEFVLSR